MRLTFHKDIWSPCGEAQAMHSLQRPLVKGLDLTVALSKGRASCCLHHSVERSQKLPQ